MAASAQAAGLAEDRFEVPRLPPLVRVDAARRSRQSPAILATRCASTLLAEGAPITASRQAISATRCGVPTLLAEGAPITAVAGHLGDTVETVSRTYVHWLRDDRDVPLAVLDRVLAPPDAIHNAP